MATTVTLKRDSGYVDRLRDYRVLLDGTEIGRIGNGATKSFEIPPGRHRLSVKIDWCASDEIEFQAVQDRTIAFNCSSPLRGAKPLFVLYYVLFARRKYLCLRPASKPISTTH